MADMRHESESLAHLVSPERWAARVRELHAELGRLRVENAILRAGVVVAIDAGHDAERALARANEEE